MRWRVIKKMGVKAPASGDYRTWKPPLAIEAALQCVYCCIHESQFGGIRNFHVEHYRPQSKFPALRNDYANLFYACGICNSFKSDDWPSELVAGDLSKPGYPYPAEVDYCDFLHVDEFNGEVVGDGVTGKYIVERLHLNRAHMVALRAMSGFLSRLESFQKQIRLMMENSEIPEPSKDEVIGMLLRTNEMLARYASARPYSPDQLR